MVILCYIGVHLGYWLKFSAGIHVVILSQNAIPININNTELIYIYIHIYPLLLILTHWGRDKRTPFRSQTIISNAFYWMKMFEFRLKFHWSLFPSVQLTIFLQWFRWWLGAGQMTCHYLNQWWLVYRRIYASLGLNELNSRLTIYF